MPVLCAAFPSLMVLLDITGEVSINRDYLKYKKPEAHTTYLALEFGKANKPAAGSNTKTQQELWPQPYQRNTPYYPSETANKMYGSTLETRNVAFPCRFAQKSLLLMAGS